MECANCGRVAPADRETGYDADEYCPRPECQAARARAEEETFIEHQLYMRALSARGDD